MQGANLGHFIDADRQGPRILFNSEMISIVVPDISNQILYTKLVAPNYDSNSGSFETGDIDPNKEIGYKKAAGLPKLVSDALNISRDEAFRILENIRAGKFDFLRR